MIFFHNKKHLFMSQTLKNQKMYRFFFIHGICQKDNCRNYRTIIITLCRTFTYYFFLQEEHVITNKIVNFFCVITPHCHNNKDNNYFFMCFCPYWICIKVELLEATTKNFVALHLANLIYQFLLYFDKVKIFVFYETVITRAKDLLLQ